MRVSLQELMDKLGVGHILGAYETAPWSCYDGETSTTCSAEIRMGADGDEIEAEIQMMRETPAEGELPMEQICYMRGAPAGNDEWTIKDLKIRNEPFDREIYNWEGKSCDFFMAVTQKLQMDEIPDIDELIDTILNSKERLADQGSGGGSKSPIIKTGELSGMTKGGGGF